MFNDDGDGDDNEHQFSPCTVKCVFLTRFRATQDAKKNVCSYVLALKTHSCMSFIVFDRSTRRLVTI